MGVFFLFGYTIIKFYLLKPNHIPKPEKVSRLILSLSLPLYIYTHNADKEIREYAFSRIFLRFKFQPAFDATLPTPAPGAGSCWLVCQQLTGASAEN